LNSAAREISLGRLKVYHCQRMECTTHMVSNDLTPVDTRGEGFLGVTGVTENAKTPGNPGFSAIGIHQKSDALPTELRLRNA
jgi:hypothetical protein